MCGIAGFSLNNDIQTAKKLIQQMLDLISHRGPDSSGSSVDATMALGASRLSIVDITHGDQPYTNETGEITVVFNGEIYNDSELRHLLLDSGHHLSSYCDGDIISHLYEEFGDRFVDKLDGMYAIALWDSANAKLILVNDPVGIKPLYFTVENMNIAFASEIKSLRVLKHQFDINPLAIGQYLLYKSIPSPLTPFDGVYKLCPGEMIVWQPNTPLQKKYIDSKSNKSEVDLLSSLQSAVVSTMRGDVDVGCIVSGGLDSSFIFQVAATSSIKRIPVFAVGYPGTLDDDEVKYAQRICQEFGGDFNKIIVSPHDIPTTLQDVLWHLDEPIQDPITVPFYLLMRAVKSQVSAVITGDGADEIFGGYSRLRHWDRAGSGLSGYSQELTVFSQKDLEEYFLPSIVPNNETSVTLSRVNSLKTAMRWEMRYRLPSYHLLRVDKLSMAWGVEARVPFLRRNIVNTANALSNDELRHQGIEKYIFRQSVSSFIPQWLLDRPKKPFTFPISGWLRDELADWVNDTLFSPNALIRDWVNAQFVSSLWNEHRTMVKDNSNQLWSLLVLELFLQQNRNANQLWGGGLVNASL